jgi:glycosyltransferase involved in cell wall biosynthesis
MNNISNNENNISVFIITHNEEKSLPYCIESIKYSNDIVVLDSFSNDKTENIALLYPTVRFFQHNFKNFSTQRNFGLHDISFKNEWVFIIDADERCTSGLWHEMLTKINIRDNSIVTYSVRRKLYYQGKWMRHNCMYPVWVERLVIPSKVKYVGDVHERLICNGEQALLNEQLIHLSFSKGINDWIQRMNKYTKIVASENKQNTRQFSISNLIIANPLEKRRTLKLLFYKCPFRWLIFLFYNFFIKWCFLDGIKGIQYIILCSYIEFITTIQEKERQEKLMI